MAEGSMEVQVEQAVGSPANLDAFLQTGRTGRRNALPDIRSEKEGAVSTADLPCSMEKLSCSDDDGASTSGNNQSQASVSSATDVSQASSSQS